MLLNSSHIASFHNPRFPYWYWVILAAAITFALLKIKY